MGLLAERGLQGVIFDMDGTLLDSTASVERCWDRISDLMGIVRTDDVFQHGVPSIPTLRRALPAATDAEISEWNRVHMRLEVEDTEGIVPIPGVFELISAIEAAGVPWAIATSCQRELAEVRHRAAGLPRPEVFVVAEDYDRGKPAPDPFLVAARRLGLDPALAVVVEDAPAGIRGGVEAGSVVCAVATTHAAEDLGEAHFVAGDLHDLRLLLLGE